MPWELSRKFKFDRKAQEVVNYILDNRESRGIKSVDGDITMFCGLDRIRDPHGHTIGVVVCISDAPPNVQSLRDNANWLVRDRELAQIRLRDTEPGLCVGELFIEIDPRRWNRDGGESPLARGLGRVLLGELWDDVIVGRWPTTQPLAAGVAAPDAPTAYAERSEKVPMKKTLTVAQPSPLAFLGEIIGWSFPFNMVDSSLVGTPEENSRTSPHNFQVSATLELVNNWGFSLAAFDGLDEQSKNDLMKVLFEHAKRYVIKKLRDTGELARIEKLDLNTSTPEARDRFDPSRIQDPVGATLEVDVDTQEVQSSADTTQPKTVLGDGQGKKEQAEDEFTVKYLARLRQDIVEHFDDSDLRDLCFDMGIDYDDLPGQSKKDKARELIARCKRTSRIRDLLAKLKDLRPKDSWEDVPE